tara:strand:- start:327 stop:455 length:129 start_codon:yes stop_codon:yes gene_type:complete
VDLSPVHSEKFPKLPKLTKFPKLPKLQNFAKLPKFSKLQSMK